MAELPLLDSSESNSYAHKDRWKHPELLKSGFVPVSIDFLDLYSKLNPPLTSGEALFVIQLMSFKWTKKDPFPSYTLLAKRMGVSDKAVRRHASSLEAKKYLIRIQRLGGTNKFDLNPLFDALLKLKENFNSRIGLNGDNKNV